jgi:hypothetical protein
MKVSRKALECLRGIRGEVKAGNQEMADRIMASRVASERDI